MSKSIKRRNLLKLFPAAAFIPALISSKSLYGCAPKNPEKKNSVFVSTWSNCLANDAAADFASKGNNVIDSIVEGISYVESDLDDRSVGKGGRPDRDGDVTLDACMMDHEGEAGGVCFMQHIELTPLPWILGLIFTLVIAWVAVGGQAFSAARVKPAEVLKSE